MRQLCILFLLFGSSQGLWAQATLARWTFENISGRPTLPIAPTQQHSSIRNPRATLVGGTNIGSPDICQGDETWATNFWPTDNIYQAGEYIQFSLENDMTYDILLITHFNFTASISSSASADRYVVRYSRNGGSFTTLRSGSFTVACGRYSSAVGLRLDPDDRVLFRIHPYSQDPAGMAASLRVDDVLIRGSVILPIALTQFTARETNAGVELAWRTEGERDNDRIIIQRSSDGLQFDSVGWVPGRGSTQQPQVYRCLDRFPLAGQQYYRLQQVDRDGSRTLHRVIAIEVRRGAALYVLGNPVRDRIQLRGRPPATQLQVLDMMGALRYRYRVDPSLAQNDIPLPSLPRGFYLVRCGPWQQRILVRGN